MDEEIKNNKLTSDFEVFLSNRVLAQNGVPLTDSEKEKLFEQYLEIIKSIKN